MIIGIPCAHLYLACRKLMSLWRKHRFISLQEQDTVDRVSSGSQFIVKRVGSTCVNDEEVRRSEEIMVEFYRDLLDLFQCEQGCLLRLIVDLSGATLYDKNGEMLQRFQLSDIRDVIYSTKTEKFSRYFILVGREEGELSVKAHVLLCEDKHKARMLYDTFIEVFTLGAEVRKYSRHVCDRNSEVDKIKQKSKLRINSDSTNNRKVSSCTKTMNGVVKTHDVHLKIPPPPRRQTWTNSSVTSRNPRTKSVEDSQLNDSFTELALSRSDCASTSAKYDDNDINCNKIPCEDSDVFM